LLAADAEEIAISVGVGGSTPYRTKRRFLVGNLEEALSEEPRPGASRKLSGTEEALLVATACSNPPEGRARWTLELLADELVRLTEHDSIFRETVLRRLTENGPKPWRKDMWCIPHIDGEYVARMDKRNMSHMRGAPCHPQTQGKIERWHQTLKNRILPENYYLPGDLEARIDAFVDHYNHRRYHESLDNLTPADIYFGRGQTAACNTK